MAITNAAGYKYIWITSSCIIKDRSDDWTHEADCMAHIYRNGTLKLVACGTPGTTIVETRNPLGYYPCRASTREDSLHVIGMSDSFREFPAYTHSWIVQEFAEECSFR